MSARDELIVKYAADLRDKCGVSPDMDLLTKVTIGCGPSIYNADAATVAGSQQAELETVKNNFDRNWDCRMEFNAGIDAVIENMAI
jgi:hypothetical protein